MNATKQPIVVGISENCPFTGVSAYLLARCDPLSWPLPACALTVRWRLSPEHRPRLGEDLLFDVLWRASCSGVTLSVRSLALRWLCNSVADKKRCPRRGFGTTGSSLLWWSDVGVANRSSCCMMASPNSLDTLCPAWMRDIAELDSCGCLGSGRGGSGSGVASFSRLRMLRGSDRDRTEVG